MGEGFEGWRWEKGWEGCGASHSVHEKGLERSAFSESWSAT